ncbi:hypothetical protein [Saccharopolyspora sp. ASAGF58]|uniref:hypothetical protein n=1 Tax=Saccharopolyspora TaxID=1835 RepID=UPI0014467D2B|nr:hypothetical protein [Saccharopolyspora sp. ASAGF58]
MPRILPDAYPPPPVLMTSNMITPANPAIPASTATRTMSCLRCVMDSSIAGFQAPDLG